MIKKQIIGAICAAALTGSIAPMVGGAAMASAAQMPNISEGYYSYTTGSSKDSGYILMMTVKKVQPGKITYTLDQSRWWPPLGGAVTSSKTIKAKIRNGKSLCKFKTFCGDTCKAEIKIVSKKKVKVRVESLITGHEKRPLTTGWEWKTLKRSKTGLL